MDFDIDVVIVGGGVVGLGIGYATARKGLSTIVLEAENHIGSGVSSRNSEVIHAGLYYPSGSLRAKLCVESRKRLYPFLADHGVPHVKCGKMIVATSEDEIPKLQAIARQAVANGVDDVELWSGEQARAREPELFALAALWSPSTGVMDSHGLMTALQGEIEHHGGHVVLNSPFLGAAPRHGKGGYTVSVGGADPTVISTRYLVTAPGLSAQSVAGAISGYPAERIPTGHFGKGCYFAYHGPAPFTCLVYPTPIPGALGTHYVRNVGGQAVFGPDLEYVDTLDYTVAPSRADAFYSQVRRFWPGLPDGGLTPDYAGIRPKIHGPGSPQPDFRIDDATIHGLEGLVALFGIESPGLTSSLALGDEVASRLTGRA